MTVQCNIHDKTQLRLLRETFGKPLSCLCLCPRRFSAGSPWVPLYETNGKQYPLRDLNSDPPWPSTESSSIRRPWTAEGSIMTMNQPWKVELRVNTMVKLGSSWVKVWRGRWTLNLTHLSVNPVYEASKTHCLRRSIFVIFSLWRFPETPLPRYLGSEGVPSNEKNQQTTLDPP